MPERKDKVRYTLDPGLRGINVGTTAICPVGEEDSVRLTYRGYPVDELAKKSTFDEVSYLLVNGELPTKNQLANWTSKIIQNRILPEELQKILDSLPITTHPMSVLRTAISALGAIFPEENFDGKPEAIRILGALPSIIGYWERRRCSHDKEVPFNSPEKSLAGYFLHTITGVLPSPVHRRTLDCSLILYAEHELAASTYATRVCASTLADYYSCIISGIGTLSGPLNGGANEAAIKLLQSFENSDDAEKSIRQMLKQRELIMGFG
ncbi:MAG: 2-methylcitrate synthase, partial [Candidatus Heimdallarchaeota archaeon]